MARLRQEADVLTKCFAQARQGAVSVIFAATAIPMIGMVGLAVDYGIWNETNAELSVAANVAALTAVKIAANAQLAGDANALTEGQQAGQQWFLAEIGANTKIGTTNVVLNGNGATVNVQNVNGTPTVTASVAYTGQVPSIFGGIFFNIVQYPIYGIAESEVASAPYLNINILLDNSGSMEIGATAADIQALQAITPCNVAVLGQPAPGAFYINGGTPAKPTYTQLAGQAYNAYVTSGYDGTAPAPQPAPIPPLLSANYPNNVFTPSGASQGASCQGAAPSYQTPFTPATTAYPLAGPPCAFACHFDTSKPAGTGNDYFALARSTIGTANPITLRFDLVKHATNTVISAMQADNIPTLNNLNVGLWTFSYGLHRVYPDATTCPGTSYDGTACEANNNWATAIADVGAPPTLPNQADTGIQASTDPNGGDTDFDDSMSTLVGEVSASGDGTKASTPRKVLFIVSDGLSDYQPSGGNRGYAPVTSADCNLFKNLGYTIYVVFTPYYPVMNGFYISNIKTYAEPLTSGPLYTALQACASGPSDFISASSGAELDAALAGFLKAALTTPARFTM